MGRAKIENVVNKCKYCGKAVNNNTICYRCMQKLKLVRILVKMCDPYRKRG